MIRAAWELCKLIPSWAYALVAVAALAGAGAIHERHVGEAITQAKWDADKAARVQADNSAILTRVKNNERVAEQQQIDNTNITKAHDEEINTLRARLAAAPRLRIGTALCGGPAASAKAEIPGGSNAADPPGRLVQPDIGRDIDALKVAVETDLAAGRACQAKVLASGLAP